MPLAYRLYGTAPLDQLGDPNYQRGINEVSGNVFNLCRAPVVTGTCGVSLCWWNPRRSAVVELGVDPVPSL